jgi:hypothetical protein
MSTILEINNWNQLVSAKADNKDLRILVTNYNSEELVATKIQIVSYKTNDVFLTLFVDYESSTILPPEVLLPEDSIVDLINSYGFNIRISQPEVLNPNVVSILQGLYDAGYRYVYRDYISNTDPIIHHNSVIYASKDIPVRQEGFNITDIPNFIIGEWNWCKPFKTYPIIDLLGGSVDNGVE